MSRQKSFVHKHGVTSYKRNICRCEMCCQANTDYEARKRNHWQPRSATGPPAPRRGPFEAQQKQYPSGRICAGVACTTVLSIYNKGKVCAHCFKAIPVNKLPQTFGRFV